MISETDFQLMNKIQIVVYYIEEERLNWIRSQFRRLNIGIDIFYFKGYTKDDCIDFITEKHTRYPKVETPGQVAAMRTIGSVFNWFIEYCKDKDFLITIEDDSCFTKEGLLDKILESVKTYSQNYDNFDYVCLGYLPFEISSIISRDVPVQNGIYYDMWKNTKSLDDFDDVYGGQMLLFNKNVVKDLSDILHQKNTKMIRDKIKYRVSKGNKYSNREDILLGDHIFPLIFRQAVLYPPLAIEGNFRTQNGNNNWTSRPWIKYLDIKGYMINV